MFAALGTEKTWVVSAIAHVSLLAVAQFGLPHFFDAPEPTPVIVPVEVVDIGAMTTPPEPATPEPEPKPQPKPEAAPPPPPQAPPEPPQAVVPEPEVPAAPPPPPPPALPKKSEPKPEPPKAAPKPAPVPETRMANAAPVTKPKPPAPARDFTSVLKDLAAEAPKTRSTPKQAPKPVTAEKKGPVSPPQPRVRDIATMTEIDALRVAIRKQIEPCWSPPIGAREAEELTVKIVVFVDPSGQVRRAEVLDAGRMALNPFFEAAADSARRAVLNDRCNPLRNLPPDRYDLWQELELTFNPKDVLG